MKKPRIKKIGWWLIALLAVAVGYFMLSDPEGLLSMYRTHAELRAVRQELARQREIADSLTVTIRRLESDTAYLEQIAREKLGMARKNERVFKFIQRKP